MFRAVEFFERQKLTTAHSMSARMPVQKRCRSQDLVALHTVSAVHSRFPAGPAKRMPIKKVDLEKFHSCTHQIDEVDMGPCSPSQTPSKLLLSEGRLDSCVNPKTGTDLRPSKGLGKPENLREYKTSRYGGDTAQKEQNLEENVEMHVRSMKNKSIENQGDVMILKQPKEILFAKPKPFDGYENSSNKTKLGFDPFASEDFQATPLVRYTKKRLPNNLEVVKQKKRKHSGESKCRVEQISNAVEKDGVHSFKPKHFTSTPVTVKQQRCDLVKDSEQFGGISPIFKGISSSKDVDSGFKFKPRPMLVTPEVIKGEQSQFLMQEKSEKESGSDKMNLDACCRMYGQKEPNYQHFIDHEDSQKYNRGELRRSLNNQDDVEGNRFMSPFYRSQLCSLRSESISSLSRSNATDDMYDSSISRDSFTSESERGNSGSLSKYKHTIRHKGRKRSPVVNRGRAAINGKDVEKEQETDKNNIENSYRTEISKPKFIDIEEDFHYKPMKPKIGMASDIMNMYKRNEKYGAGERKCQMLNETKRGYDRLSGGSVQGVPSPVPADEFPQHLLSPSEQDEIDRKLSQIVKDERKEKSEQMQDEDGARFYKQLKCPMDDVLNELKQLEEQDAVTPSAPADKMNKVNPQAPEGDVATESAEADTFLETEDLLLQNADIGYMEKMEENGNDEKSVNSEKDTDIKDQEIQVQNNAINRCIDPVNCMLDKSTDMGSQFSVDTGKTGETNTEVDIKIGKIPNASSNFDMIGISSETGKVIHRILEINNAVKSCKEFKLEISDRSENGITSCSPLDKLHSDNSEKAAVKGNVTIQSIGITGKHDRTTEISDNTAKTVEDFHKKTDTSKLEANETSALNQLQVPEISSGKNKFTQTDTDWNHLKSFVEASTSPLHALEVQELADTGIQCDLASFPTLLGLAGKCFSVKAAKSATSLHETEEIKNDSIIPADNESIENLGSEGVSAAQTYMKKLTAKYEDGGISSPSQ